LLIVMIVMRTPFPSAAARHDGLLSVIPSAIVLAIAAIALLPRARIGASLLLVAAVIAEMWPLTIGWNSPFPINSFYPRTPLIDRLKVRWVMTEPNRELTDSARYVLRYAGSDGRLYENLHAMPRFFGDGARVAITSARGDEYSLDVDAAKETLIQSSVGASRWWRVSGAQAMANGPFLVLTVPAGHTTVRIRYVDTSFRIASLIALLTAAALLCFM